MALYLSLNRECEFLSKEFLIINFLQIIIYKLQWMYVLSKKKSAQKVPYCSQDWGTNITPYIKVNDSIA